MSAATSLDSPRDLQRLMGAPYPLSAEQFAAVTAPLEPGLVVAGAGSGKTTVMAARVVWLVASGAVAPGQVLGLTFTTKAAGELGQRIRQVLRASGLLDPPAGEPGEEPEEPTVSTYHAYAASLLGEHGLRLGHEPDTRVLADASRYQLAARAIARHRGRVEALSDHPATVIRYLLGLESMMSEHLASADDLRAEQERLRRGFEATVTDPDSGRGDVTEAQKALALLGRRDELLGLVEDYRDLKHDLGLMDFADQIELGARLATEHPDVGRAERERFRVVLLDEYQDTSVAQALMLSHLFSGPDPEHGRGHPVTAVGDPNQAIYGWRGASVSNILSFPRVFPRADGSDATQLSLATNRRSGSLVLDVANALAEPLLAASDAVRPLAPAPGAEPGAVAVHVHESDLAELAWLPGRVRAAREELSTSWREVAVLVRDNSHAAQVYDALTAEDVPVEIVGLQGLLRLPEVAEVVATLTLLSDLTANDALITLLTGPRWAIGARDLSLLGRRARSLALGTGETAPRDAPLDAAMDAAVAGADPADVVSLADALESPGDLAYSPAAQERFALLADELRRLRRAAGEPLLDLVRRILEVTGADVELDACVSPSARARRENLDLFVQAVADFSSVDGAVSLPSLLAYLQAEDELGTGLDVATPSAADSVKLLTVHRAKGLEWDAVLVVGMSRSRFPTETARPSWLTVPHVLPVELRGDRADLPSLRSFDKAGIAQCREGTKAVEATEELRLGYVALTRPRRRLVLSSYCWKSGRTTPLGPSAYLETVRTALAAHGQACPDWIDAPEKGDERPLGEEAVVLSWPREGHPPEVAHRREAAQLVEQALAGHDAGAHPTPSEEGLSDDELALVAAWDVETDRLLAEAERSRAEVVEVPVPSSLAATALSRLRESPQAFAAQVGRPMPRPPSPQARFGTRFHAYVERLLGQQQLLDPDDLPGRADTAIDGEADLAELTRAFREGPFGERVPRAVEPSFACVLGGQVVRGRIDAVYDEDDGTVLLVDWKTNRHHDADPLQLAVYRVAWAELHGLPLEQVRAAFYYVRDGALVEPAGLPDRDELERLVTAR